MKDKIYIKIKDGEVFKTTPMYTGTDEIMVDFDHKWNALGITISKYVDFKILSESELLTNVKQ